MMNLIKAEQLMLEKLANDPKRIKHVYGVRDVARKLAVIHQIDTYKASIAALLHDVMKIAPLDEQISYLDSDIIKHYEKTPVMYHALSAAKFAQKHGLNDQDIINAISYHVWGRKEMSKLEKIIFISDYCEPNRMFDDQMHIFYMATKDLDQTTLYCMKLTQDEVQFKQRHLHPDQQQAYQYYMEEIHAKTQSNT